jgi:hypothetical protein
MNLLDHPATTWDRFNVIDKRILLALESTPGLTCKQLGDIVSITDTTYGKVMAPARRVAFLRSWGLVTDVSHRCAACNSALSRGERNVPLSLTPAGIEFLTEVRMCFKSRNLALAA